MGKYESRLSSLTNADLLSRLEGQGGLLALSSRELFFLNDHSEQSARLASIKRIGVNKTSGNVDVIGDQGTLLEIPPTAFQKDELKLFLESLKGHVLRAKTNPTMVEPEPVPAPVVPAAPMATSTASAVLPPPVVEPEPMPEPEPEPVPFHQAEPESPRFPTPIPDHFTPPPSPTLSDPINIAEPPKTLPDDPDSIWAYEGQAKPVTATQEMPPMGRPATESNISQDVVPPAPSATPVLAPAAAKTQTRILSYLLKIFSGVTVLASVLYLGFTFFMPTSAGTVDTMFVALMVVFGVALALIQWALSELT